MKRRKPMDPPAYAAMRAESRRLRLPRRFRTDLTRHDRQLLRKLRADAQFVWILREDGTHLWTVDFVDGAGNTAAELIRYAADTWPSARFYLWDGGSLLSMDSSAVAAERTEELAGRSKGVQS